MQHKDVVEVRRILDSKRLAGKDYSEEQSILTEAYIRVIDGKKDFPYSYNDVSFYLADYFQRNIFTAEVLIRRCLQDNFSGTVGWCRDLQNFAQTPSEKKAYEGLWGIITAYKNELNEKYVCHEIEYNITDAKKYVHHWLNGINQAEIFLERVIKDSPKTIEQIFDVLIDSPVKKYNDQANRLANFVLNLLSKDTSEEFNTEIFNLIASLTAKRQIGNALRPNENPHSHTKPIAYRKKYSSEEKLALEAKFENLSKALDNAFEEGVLDAVLQNRNWCEILAPHTADCSPLRFIKHPEVIQGIYSQMSDVEHRRFFISLVFSYSLLDNLTKQKSTFEMALILIKESLLKVTNNKLLSLNEASDNHYDLSAINYYLASLNKDEKDLITLIYASAETFKALFLQEMELMKDPQMEAAVKNRAAFYTGLLTTKQVQSSYGSALDSAINQVFSRHGLLATPQDESHLSYFQPRPQRIDEFYEVPNDNNTPVQPAPAPVQAPTSSSSSSPNRVITFLQTLKKSGKQEDEETPKRRWDVLGVFPNKQRSVEMETLDSEDKEMTHNFTK